MELNIISRSIWGIVSAVVRKNKMDGEQLLANIPLMEYIKRNVSLGLLARVLERNGSGKNPTSIKMFSMLQSGCHWLGTVVFSLSQSHASCICESFSISARKWHNMIMGGLVWNFNPTNVVIINRTHTNTGAHLNRLPIDARWNRRWGMLYQHPPVYTT